MGGGRCMVAKGVMGGRCMVAKGVMGGWCMVAKGVMGGGWSRHTVDGVVAALGGG